MKPPRNYTLPSDIRWGEAFRSLSTDARALYADFEAIANDQSGYLQILGNKLGVSEIARYFFRGDIAAAHACITELLEKLSGLGIISRQIDGGFVLDFIAHASGVRQARAAGGGKSVLNPSVPRAKTAVTKGDLHPVSAKHQHIATVTPIVKPPAPIAQSDFFEDASATAGTLPAGTVFAEEDTNYASILCGGAGIFRPGEDPIRFAFPAKGSAFYVGVTESKVQELAQNYGMSESDTLRYLAEARQWAHDHRQKRDGKTVAGMHKFISSWIRRESKKIPLARSLPQASAAIREIFDFWVQTMQPESSQAVLDRQRASIIEGALALGYSAESLRKAIVGCRRSAFHMGENDQNAKFNALSVIFQGADRIEKFIALSDAPTEPATRGDREFQATVNVLNDWLSSGASG